jgi:hypothetical protein
MTSRAKIFRQKRRTLTGLPVAALHVLALLGMDNWSIGGADVPAERVPQPVAGHGPMVA